MMNEAIELKEAVFTTQTNWILKQMARKYYQRRKNSSYSKTNKELMNLLEVDFQTTEPIYFTGAYKKKEHENNLFIFLDKEFQIIGILKGNSWNEDKYLKFEDYDKENAWNGGFKLIVKKNRKNMTELATHILMITPEIKPNFSKKEQAQSRFMDSKRAKNNLHSRLSKYKVEKYNSISDFEVKAVIEKALVVCSMQLFKNTNERKELIQKLNKVFGWTRYEDELSKHIADIADLGREYEKNLKEHQEFLKMRNGVDNEWNWHRGYVEKAKVTVGKLKKVLEGEI